MLRTDRVVNAVDAALHEAPEAVDGVRVNLTAHPFVLRVIHAAVNVAEFGKQVVAGEFVGVDPRPLVGGNYPGTSCRGYG